MCSDRKRGYWARYPRFNYEVGQKRSFICFEILNTNTLSLSVYAFVLCIIITRVFITLKRLSLRQQEKSQSLFKNTGSKIVTARRF